MAAPEQDKELAKALAIAKKKPRNFVIIAKGLNVLRLIIDKKPIKDGAVLAAKKESGGNVVTRGVVSGAGSEFIFRITEETKVNPLKLKDFIANVAGMVAKPRFELVPELAEVNDESPDDELETPPAGVSPTSVTPATTTSSVPSPHESESTQFAQRLKALKPALDRLLGSGSPLADQCRTLASESAMLARKPDFAGALQVLSKLEELVREGSKSWDMPAKEAASGKSMAGPGTTVEQTTAFSARLKELMPRIAAASNPDAGKAAKLKASEAGTLARKHEFAQANALLDEVARLLADQTGTSTDSGSTTSEPSSGKLDVLAVWRDAKEETDGQFQRLAAKLRKAKHPFLRRVAELGLQGLASDPGRVFVSLQASLFDYQGSTGEARRESSERVLSAVQSYRSFVRASRLIEVFEKDTQFGPITITSTLLGALDTIEREVRKSNG